MSKPQQFGGSAFKASTFSPEMRVKVPRHISSSQPLKLIETNKPAFTLRKSIFSPSQETFKSLLLRSSFHNPHILKVQIVYESSKWLLLECIKYETTFFQWMNSRKNINVFSQLLKVLEAFVVLSQKYGFFEITRKMIFLDGSQCKVWINEDVFCNRRMIPLQYRERSECEEAFVKRFDQLLSLYVKNWQKLNPKSIFQFKAILLQKSTHMSFTSNQYKNIHKEKRLSQMHPNNSCHFKNKIPVMENEESSIFNSIEFKELKESNCDQKSFTHADKHGEHCKSKKMFGLTSTSSTLEMFSEKGQKDFLKFRPSQERKSKTSFNEIKNAENIKQKSSQTENLKQKASQSENIEDQLDDLFKNDKNNDDILFGVDGNAEQLQKIAEEIEQILLW